MIWLTNGTGITSSEDFLSHLPLVRLTLREETRSFLGETLLVNSQLCAWFMGETSNLKTNWKPNVWKWFYSPCTFPRLAFTWRIEYYIVQEEHGASPCWRTVGWPFPQLAEWRPREDSLQGVGTLDIAVLSKSISIIWGPVLCRKSWISRQDAETFSAFSKFRMCSLQRVSHSSALECRVWFPPSRELWFP